MYQVLGRTLSLQFDNNWTTVHSPIRLENHTSHPLSFILHLTSSGDGPKHADDNSESRIPCHGPLAPGSQCYLPLSALR